MTNVKQRKNLLTSDGKQKKDKNIKSKEENKKSTSLNGSEIPQSFKIDYKRIGLRCILIFGLITFMSYNLKENFKTFASQSEEIKNKKSFVKCSPDFTKDIKAFPGCMPNECGRMVTDYVIQLSEVQALLIIAQKALSLGGSAGGASILDLHSGALSQGNNFVDIYKIDKSHKAISAEDLKFYKHVKNKIMAAVAKNFGLNAANLYLTHPTFFSRITSSPAQTVHDEYWHPHVDQETYKSFHYTSLLYLSNYGQDFKGGRFVFVDSAANTTVEPKEGRLSMFTSGAENLHYVEKVTSGTRYAITVSFTCDPKYAIVDPSLDKKNM